MKTLVIDGDVIAYRAAWSCDKDTEEEALAKVDELIDFIFEQCTGGGYVGLEPYFLYTTGKTNFRNEIAVSHPYKGNRKDVPKPIHLAAVYKHLTDKWEAILSVNEEADDLIGIKSTELGDDCIVVTTDKDMQQLPCSHFNLGKGTMNTVDTFGGLRFFYSQILTGDTADNIKGLFRVGPVKAYNALADCKDENDLMTAVIKMYAEHKDYEDKDYDYIMDRIIENGKLLWLRRKVGQVWQPYILEAVDE